MWGIYAWENSANAGKEELGPNAFDKAVTGAASEFLYKWQVTKYHINKKKQNSKLLCWLWMEMVAKYIQSW